MPDLDPDFHSFARSADAGAFRRLVERHVDAVHSAARRILDDRSDAAADVAQAVFIQLARKAAVLPEDLVVGSWLHRQTVRLALNARRADARRTVRERTAHELLVMSADESATNSAALRPFIDQAIHALPELDQRVLTMHYFDQCQQREIAERLGMSAGAVQKRLSRALERVRLHLARRGVTVPAAAIGLWLGGSSVEAAPSALGPAIAAKALPFAAAGTSFTTKLTATLMNTKALAAGAAIGLAAGGFWTVQSATAPSPTMGTAGTSAPAPTALSNRSGVPASGYDRSPVPEPAATPEGLVAQLQAILAQPANILTEDRLNAWLAGISREAWPAFAALAGERLFTDERRRCMEWLAYAWARIDPEAAVPGMAAQKISPGGTELAGAAFFQWHGSDPTAAQSWLVQHQNDAPLAKCLPDFITTVAQGLQAKSDDAVIAWAAQLGGDDFRKAALKPVIPNLMKNNNAGEWGRLCTALATYPDTGFATMALREVFSDWMRTGYTGYSPKRMSVSEADAWIGTLPPGPQAALAADLLLKAAAANSWDEIAPRQALAHLQSTQPDVLEEKARQIITGSKGLGAGARSWLLPLLTGPDRDALIHQAALQTAVDSDTWRVNGEVPRYAAAIQWAAELTDPSMRDPLIHDLYLQWLQDNDQPANKGKDAQRWMDRCPLPPEIKAITQLAHADFVPRMKSDAATAK